MVGLGSVGPPSDHMRSFQDWQAKVVGFADQPLAFGPQFRRPFGKDAGHGARLGKLFGEGFAVAARQRQVMGLAGHGVPIRTRPGALRNRSEWSGPNSERLNTNDRRIFFRFASNFWDGRLSVPATRISPHEKISGIRHVPSVRFTDETGLVSGR
jgi:hypothetical protein